MKTRDLLNLVVLGAIWGISFMFIRVSAPEFGAVALMAVRVLLASLVLLPVMAAHKALPEIIANWRPIALMGVLHYAIPFCLFAYSMLTITGGLSAIINASSPLFAGVIAWILLGERPTASRTSGLFIGFTGVVILVWDKLVLNDGTTILAIGASVLAAFFYGLAAVLAKKQLTGVSPTAVSTGSMVTASAVLLPASFWFVPAIAPSASAWAMAILLGVLCTAIAFLLYFRLIANIGPTRAITVTFLIPVFAVLFGALFIGEQLTRPMIIGGVVVLLGTALSTGLLKFRE
jgi:drug/metabolite transporter (DMT)-like permease